jgi:hypothetical protein
MNSGKYVFAQLMALVAIKVTTVVETSTAGNNFWDSALVNSLIEKVYAIW